MYSFIFLIISSNDVPQYLEMKKISQKYYSLFKNNIKYFYIEFKPEQSEEIIENDDHIYIKGTESIIPGILNKTQKALNYINQKYEFKYVIRTNLSSFWNLYNLLDLECKLPSSFFGGLVTANIFISGTGIIMSNNISKQITPLIDVNSFKHDDLYISNLLRGQNIHMLNIENYNYKIEYLINDNKNKIPENTNNILYFRIKNLNRNIDIDLFKTLLNKLYNLN